MILQSVSDGFLFKEPDRLGVKRAQRSETSSISENIKKFLEHADSISKELIDIFPYPIFITTMDTMLLLVNEQATKIFPGNIIGDYLCNMANPEMIAVMKKKLLQMEEQNIKIITFEYKYNHTDNICFELEITVCLLTFREIPAVMVLTRDIGEAKQELLAAGSFQKGLLKRGLPFGSDKVESKIIYVPARTVSGDFYFFYKTDDKHMMGMIGDVSGKGVAAALGISAFNVLFHEGTADIKDPYDLTKKLNEKSAFYLGERFVAACIFDIDFDKRQLRAVGAGINQFVYRKSAGTLKRYTIRGPFLGMFEDSTFEEVIIDFEPEDEFIFYSDGMDFAFSAGEVDLEALKETSTDEVISYVESAIDNMLINIEGLPDDCTMIVIKIK